MPSAVVCLSIMVSSCGIAKRTNELPQAPQLACQTVKCECREEKHGLFRAAQTAGIIWQANGDAACPEGFLLKKSSKAVRR